jgi:hypothetical protein
MIVCVPSSARQKPPSWRGERQSPRPNIRSLLCIIGLLSGPRLWIPFPGFSSCDYCRIARPHGKGAQVQHRSLNCRDLPGAELRRQGRESRSLLSICQIEHDRVASATFDLEFCPD